MADAFVVFFAIRVIVLLPFVIQQLYLDELLTMLKNLKRSTLLPRVYEAIRDDLLKKHMMEKEAKSRAAAIYVSKGKTPAERSARAKALQKG